MLLWCKVPGTKPCQGQSGYNCALILNVSRSWSCSAVWIQLSWIYLQTTSTECTSKLLAAPRTRHTVKLEAKTVQKPGQEWLRKDWRLEQLSQRLCCLPPCRSPKSFLDIVLGHPASAEGWWRWPPGIPSNLTHSVILCFCGLKQNPCLSFLGSFQHLLPLSDMGLHIWYPMEVFQYMKLVILKQIILVNWCWTMTGVSTLFN